MVEKDFEKKAKRGDFIEMVGGYALYKGLIYPWKNRDREEDKRFSVGKWFKHWEGIIEEIKNLRLEDYQIEDLHSNYKQDLLLYGYHPDILKNMQKLNELGNKLKLAFYQAQSNYRDSRRGFWGFVAGLFANKTLENLNNKNLFLPLR